MTDLPKRKHTRARWHDYNDGYYFVTVCTRDMVCKLGKITDGKMSLYELGDYLNEQLSTLSQRLPYADVCSHVVMPNHFHAIIAIYHEKARRMTDDAHSFSGLQSLLSRVVAQLKAAVTRHARNNCITFAWQSGFHDHIIRSQAAFDNIARYIEENPERWLDDRFHR